MSDIRDKWRKAKSTVVNVNVATRGQDFRYDPNWATNPESPPRTPSPNRQQAGGQYQQGNTQATNPGYSTQPSGPNWNPQSPFTPPQQGYGSAQNQYPFQPSTPQYPQGANAPYFSGQGQYQSTPTHSQSQYSAPQQPQNAYAQYPPSSSPYSPPGPGQLTHSYSLSNPPPQQYGQAPQNYGFVRASTMPASIPSSGSSQCTVCYAILILDANYQQYCPNGH
jgi:hypothetical protein